MNDSKRYLKKSVQSFPCGEVMKNGFIRISGHSDMLSPATVS